MSCMCTELHKCCVPARYNRRCGAIAFVHLARKHGTHVPPAVHLRIPPSSAYVRSSGRACGVDASQLMHLTPRAADPLLPQRVFLSLPSFLIPHSLFPLPTSSLSRTSRPTHLLSHERSPMAHPPASAPSHLVQNYRRQEVAFVRGEGCYLFDAQGRRYLDAFAGVAVSALGHAHPALVAAISRQAGLLLHVSNHYTIPEQEALATRLCAHAFPGQVLFCNSGTEANEIAYKAARLFGNVRHQGTKTRMLAFSDGFHGRTLGSLSITATAAYREPFAPLPPAEFLPFGDATALERAMGPDVAAVFIEPIQGEGGVNVAPPGFLALVRAACDRHQALMVVDEVQTGIGRTGRAFGYQHSGITPDIITLAKGLGGGVPIGAALLRPEYAALITPGTHGTTFGGNPLACAAAEAVTGLVLEEGMLSAIRARSQQLETALRAQVPQFALRGQGLLFGLQLPVEPGPVVKACLAEGLVVGPSGHQTLRLAPPLIISAAQVDELVAALVRALAGLGQGLAAARA